MTTISPSLTAYTKFMSRHAAANEIKTTTDGAKLAERSTNPTPAPTNTTDGVRGVKVAVNQKSLIDSRTSFLLADVKTAITSKRALIQPIKVPPVSVDDETTKLAQPIKVPPATTEPVAPIDELADQPPVKAPPGEIWTPYDPVAHAPLDGGFVITMGPDGTAICGPGPSGPFKWPPLTDGEPM